MTLFCITWWIALTINADAEADGPFRFGNLSILVRVAESRKVFRASFRSDDFTDETAEDTEFASVQLSVPTFVQLGKFPLNDSPFRRLCDFIHLSQNCWQFYKINFLNKKNKI